MLSGACVHGGDLRLEFRVAHEGLPEPLEVEVWSHPKVDFGCHCAQQALSHRLFLA